MQIKAKVKYGNFKNVIDALISRIFTLTGQFFSQFDRNKYYALKVDCF